MEPKKEVIFSERQKDVFGFIQYGSGNAVIKAVAGSGKTFTIVNALKFIPPEQTVIFVAFNKSIANELTKKVQALGLTNVEVRTLHSFGARALTYHYKSILDNDKVYRVAQTLFPAWNIEDPDIANGYIGRVTKLVSLARLSLADDATALFNVSIKHDIELLDNEVEHAIDVLRIIKADNRQHDFTDMIYKPVANKLKVKQYDWVFVDECQDLSKCSQELLKMMIKPKTGRYVAVGDPNQCIYGFAGADIDSFNNLVSTPNTKVLPLSTTYRCGKKIVEKAQTIVPEIEAHRMEDGLVRYNGKISEILEGDFVLCRTTKPLISLCLDFISDNKKAFVKGADIGASLATMLKRTKKTKTEDALKFFEEDLRKIKNKLVRKGLSSTEAMESQVYQSYKQKIDAIEVLCNGRDSVEEVITMINNIFSDDRPGICLSTVHKAKGLENKRVFIIEPSILRAPWAKQQWEREQEKNIEYVAITRAEEELIYIPEENFTTYDKRK